MNVEETINALLTKWASAPSGINAASREALCASVVGAVAVDGAITKMASSGQITADEAEFLRGLHAEAVGEEIGAFTKSAGVPEFLGNALMAPARHPKLTGAIVGAGLGAGLGAWKDDENRLRGAALYAVPGAAIGAMGGAFGEEALGRWANRQPHSLTAQAEGLVPDALALAKARLKSEEAGRHVAMNGPSPRRDLYDFDARLASRVRARNHADALEEAAAIARHADAQRWYQSLRDTAQHVISTHPDQNMRIFAGDYDNTLASMKDTIINHRFLNPNGIPHDVINEHFKDRHYLDELHALAAKFHALGI